MAGEMLFPPTRGPKGWLPLAGASVAAFVPPDHLDPDEAVRLADRVEEELAAELERVEARLLRRYEKAGVAIRVGR